MGINAAMENIAAGMLNVNTLGGDNGNRNGIGNGNGNGNSNSIAKPSKTPQSSRLVASRRATTTTNITKAKATTGATTTTTTTGGTTGTGGGGVAGSAKQTQKISTQSPSQQPHKPQQQPQQPHPSFRVTMSDFPPGDLKKFNETVARIFSFLTGPIYLASNISPNTENAVAEVSGDRGVGAGMGVGIGGVMTAEAMPARQFWNCLSIDEAIARAGHLAFVPLALNKSSKAKVLP